MKHLNILFIVFISCFGFIAVNPNSLWAATRYVGSNELYQTIQSAIDASNNGDTIIVKDGTYKEAIVINKALIVKSLNGNQSTFIEYPKAKDVVKISSDNVTLQGFTISSSYYYVGWKSDSNGIGLYYVSNCIISDNRTGIDQQHSNETGIYLLSSNGNTLIQNTCNNMRDDDGIYLENSSDNYIHSNTCNYNDDGIYIDKTSLKNTIDSNSCKYNRFGGIVVYGDETVLTNNICNSNGTGMRIFSPNNEIFDNTCETNKEYGICLNDDAYFNFVAGNTCKYNNKIGIYLFSQSQNNFVYFNNLISNVTNAKFNRVFSQNTNSFLACVSYDYKGKRYSGFLGNYYSDHQLTDSNGDGITDSSYKSYSWIDNYPLAMPIENYTNIKYNSCSDTTTTSLPTTTTRPITTTTTTTVRTTTTTGLTTTTTIPGPGYKVADDLWIRAVIHTEDRGPIEGIWRKGGEDANTFGTFIWGYFYASPHDVSWGSADNPEIFVKIAKVGNWVNVNYFHVSVPEITVYTDFPYDGIPDAQDTATGPAPKYTSYRFIEHTFENGRLTNKKRQFENGYPSGAAPNRTPYGYQIHNNLRIGAVINSVSEQDGKTIVPIEGIWKKGGETSTSFGTTIWGYFYANPNQVSWGSNQNPDLFVKILAGDNWAIVNYFHVSAPNIER